MVGLLTDAFAWLVILTFVVGSLFEYASRRKAGGFGRRVDSLRNAARSTTSLAWLLFAAFWLVLFPHFAFTHKSYVEGILAFLAVPACVYAGYLLWTGRDSLFVLSRSVAIMGLIYLPFETIQAFTLGGVHVPAPRKVLIEIVAAQTGTMMGLLGYHPELLTNAAGYANTYEFVAADGHVLHFSVVLACTGLGSMAIFAGLIGAVRAPLRRKVRALGVAIPVIYALNLVRTTFIGVAFGGQLLHVYPDAVLFLFGASDEYKVSWFVSDRILSQLLAVLALVALTYVVVRELPEVLTIIEDVLYMVTNEEYDLSEALDLPRARTDGPDSRQPAR